MRLRGLLKATLFAWRFSLSTKIRIAARSEGQVYLSRRCFRILENVCGGLLANHVDGAGQKEPRYSGKDRCVNDSQCCGAMYLEAAIYNTAVLRITDRAGAGSMMAPRLVANILSNLVGTDYLRTGKLLLLN